MPNYDAWKTTPPEYCEHCSVTLTVREVDFGYCEDCWPTEDDGD